MGGGLEVADEEVLQDAGDKPIFVVASLQHGDETMASNELPAAIKTVIMTESRTLAPKGQEEFKSK